MASALMDIRKLSLLEPKKYVVMAKRVSEDGHLILVRNPSKETAECEPVTRKGRVCTLGPMADMITIKGIKTKQALKDCHTVGKNPYDPLLMRSTVPDTLFLYQQYKLDIKGLHPLNVKPKGKLKVVSKQGLSKPTEKPKTLEKDTILEEPELVKLVEESAILEEPPPVEEIEIVEQLQPITEQDLNVIEDLQTPEEPSKIDRIFTTKGKSAKLDPRAIFGNTLPEDRFGNLKSTPLSSISEFSVIVRWKQHPSIPFYSLKNVFQILSRHGTLVAIGQLSPNSCLVLFAQFSVAINVVREALIGPKAYPLICTWYYSYMYLDSLEVLDVHPYIKYKIESEESKKMRQFRDMQESVVACIKLRGAGLSYDRNTFKA